MAESIPLARYAEFASYVEDRGPALLRMAISVAGNREDAEDLLQTALVKTFFAWDRISSPRARDGYVRRAMTNTQISEWRRRRLEIYPTAEIPEQLTEDPTWHSDLADAVERAVAKLPPRQQATLRLRYYEDRTEAEVARMLGVSVGTVKSTVARAVAKLRKDTELAAEPDLGR
ncbi:SigE family RNA polymerase sigma factor [Lipingzhangella sp. LS1_29]|uniref:SigE family RNA polymerase sigma factor n=1 Tax=Lipingzhangella rawalii TaxID=2055835 RepID=A0ABU2H9D6_9ACTN|nr:SigE family RNA polymerase sigma factor [Lipingzhangella rawalii]MDS1271878.1 SigE family RNA polymerase sigma factor [Lipingzhangella rawalii]